MDIQFHQSALADYQQWADEDKKIFKKLAALSRRLSELLLPVPVNLNL